MATRYGNWCALMSLYLVRMVDGGGGVIARFYEGEQKAWSRSKFLLNILVIYAGGGL
jgi:hypothetical protein